MKKQIAVLPGDGIGEEVMSAALRVLSVIEKRFGHQFTTTKALVGGAAYDKHSCHLPEETLSICKSSDAILFGSVGGPVNEQHLPKWKDAEKNAVLGIRKAFGFGVSIYAFKNGYMYTQN